MPVSGLDEGSVGDSKETCVLSMLIRETLKNFLVEDQDFDHKTKIITVIQYYWFGQRLHNLSRSWCLLTKAAQPLKKMMPVDMEELCTRFEPDRRSLESFGSKQHHPSFALLNLNSISTFLNFFRQFANYLVKKSKAGNLLRIL